MKAKVEKDILVKKIPYKKGVAGMCYVFRKGKVTFVKFLNCNLINAFEKSRPLA
jgi:hypothetical protein